jgi:hypothetical protein
MPADRGSELRRCTPRRAPESLDEPAVAWMTQWAQAVIYCERAPLIVGRVHVRSEDLDLLSRMTGPTLPVQWGSKSPLYESPTAASQGAARWHSARISSREQPSADANRTSTRASASDT